MPGSICKKGVILSNSFEKYLGQLLSLTFFYAASPKVPVYRLLNRQMASRYRRATTNLKKAFLRQAVNVSQGTDSKVMGGKLARSDGSPFL